MSRHLWIVLIASAACADVGSSSVLTSGMSAVIRGVSEDGASTRVSTVLRAGGVTSTTFVRLEADDALTVNVGEETVPLVEASLGPLVSYLATVPAADPDATFTVAFDRTIDDGAPSSTFSLPEPFAITTDPGSIDPTQPVQVAWEPSGSTSQVVLEVTGDCVDGGLETLNGDDGVTTIPAGLLEQRGETPGASCEVTATISKIDGGQLDPAFGEGGSAQGVQQRAIAFTMTFGD